MNIIASRACYALLIAIKTYTAAEATVGINKILTSCGMGVGAIIATVGLIKLMLSLADENAVSKQQSSLLIGVGIFFLSLSTIVDGLQTNVSFNSSGGGKDAAAYIMITLGKMVTWGGAVLAAVAIIMLILSIANEQSEQKANASKLLGCSIGLLSISGTVEMLANDLRQGQGFNANYVVRTIIHFIGTTSTYIGAGLVIMAIWHFVLSIKEESAKDRETAVRFAIVGIALISIISILKSMELLPK